ncbi:MAG TPA: BlaI/MecI/CopY family transcriptional regulator [Solirubrobacteraceae bacterium]|nr:BlaI/MecI/CopY family transcriptional regulator [Solirubrobacteraceae bacterium]
MDRRSERQRQAKDPLARYLGAVQAELMGIFWTRESATVRELRDDLHRGRRRKLAYTTVLTLVSRLWQRGLLAREPEGRGFRYRPAKTREELLAELSDELINRLFDDFGEIALARLDARLGPLEPGQRRRLAQAARKR